MKRARSISTKPPTAADPAETERNLRDWPRKLAIDGAVAWMDNAIDSIESDLVELRRYRERFVDVMVKGERDSFSTPVNVISWFTNKLALTGNNARIDLAPNHAAALALTEPKE